MDIKEFNEIGTNNFPETYSVNTNNIETSDEIAPENQDSLYAKNKRASKAANTLSIIAISGVAILGGSSLLSSLITDPEIKDIQVNTTSNSIVLETTIANPQGLEVVASIFEDNSLKEKTDLTYKGERSFSYTFDNIDFLKENVLKISFSNHLDYSKIIYEKAINSQMEAKTNIYIGGNYYETI